MPVVTERRVYSSRFVPGSEIASGRIPVERADTGIGDLTRDIALALFTPDSNGNFPSASDSDFVRRFYPDKTVEVGRRGIKLLIVNRLANRFSRAEKYPETRHESEVALLEKIREQTGINLTFGQVALLLKEEEALDEIRNGNFGKEAGETNENARPVHAFDFRLIPKKRSVDSLRRMTKADGTKVIILGKKEYIPGQVTIIDSAYVPLPDEKVEKGRRHFSQPPKVENVTISRISRRQESIKPVLRRVR